MGNKPLHQKRLERIEKTINFEPVDQIPIIYAGIAAGRNFGTKSA